MKVELEKGSLGFTFCTVSITYTLSDEKKVVVIKAMEKITFDSTLDSKPDNISLVEMEVSLVSMFSWMVASSANLT